MLAFLLALRKIEDTWWKHRPIGIGVAGPPAAPPPGETLRFFLAHDLSFAWFAV